MRRMSLTLVLCLLIVSSMIIPVSLGYNVRNTIEQQQEETGPMNSPWPMFGHDARHTGRSQYSTASNTGEIKWYYETDWLIESTPAIDNNGTIYVVDWHHLHAFNPDGTVKWLYEQDDITPSSPAIAEDGTIYFGDNSGKLYAINPNGTPKWKFKANSPIKSSPTIGPDGVIYFNTFNNNGRFYAVYPNGTEKWSYNADFFCQKSPAIADNGAIFFNSHVHLCAFYPNGTLIWKKKLGDQDFKFLGGPAIGDDGIIYIPCDPGHLYAIYPNNGTVKWRSSTASSGWGTPSIGYDGTIYTGNKHMYAFNPDGTIKWIFRPDNDNYHFIDSHTYAISTDGTIYIGTNKEYDYCYIIALNPDGSEKWRQRISNYRALSSPIIGDDGTVYIGSCQGPYPTGCLYAFNELDPDAPSAPNIDGPSNGGGGKVIELNFTSTSPVGRDVYYWIDWNDGESEEWIGPFDSGNTITKIHVWPDDKSRTYTVKARAKDTENLWGPESEFKVTIPRNHATHNVWQGFLDMFPILERIIGLLR